MKGKVRWFNKDKGYGFLIPEDGSKDVFIHARELHKSNINPNNVLPDMSVMFQRQEGEKGSFAIEVKIL